MNLFELPEEPFVVPDPATPRQRWTATASQEGPGWPRIDVTVTGIDGERWQYRRNYSMLRTFEPFRQLRNGVWHEYALISESYTRTSVMDLASGEIVAVEQLEPGVEGFCPMEFHVADWWEPDRWGSQDGSLLPDDELWEPHMGARRGLVAAVAGCVWGDDHSRKLQLLDLRHIADGVITRHAPFGYVELADGVDLATAVDLDWETRRAHIAVSASFSFRAGALEPWSMNGLTRRDG